MLKKIIFPILFIAVFSSCQKEDKIEKEIAKIPISFQVERFDQKFAEASPQDLSTLKKNYPFLFPKQYGDSIWIDKMNDSIQQEIDHEVTKKYPNFDKEKTELHGLFQHLKYYFSDFKTPRVITVTTDVDYRNSVILTDSLLLIGLDNYLGKEHRFYYGIQRYIAKNFIPSQIVPTVARRYAKKYIPQPKGRDFLDDMVYYGKIKYFEQKMLPNFSTADIMGYTTEELHWAEENERQIWGYFIEKSLLYKTSGSEMQRRFFEIGPFTKFGLNLDSKSPAQLGQYIGWKIVEQYAEKHENVPLPELLKMNNEMIYKESNYKPKQQ